MVLPLGRDTSISVSPVQRFRYYATPTSYVMANYRDRQKTKEWLTGQGYRVARGEITYTIQTPAGPRFVKYDVWGADWIARNAEHLVFIQQKKSKVEIPRAIEQLTADNDWPEGSERWVLWWPRRAREPDILIVASGQKVLVDEHGEPRA